MTKRPLLLACAAAATLFAASAAQASRVSWSVGINVPPVATYVTSGPAWAPAPVYAPPPVVYSTPAPVYAPAPIVYDEPYVEPYIVPRVGFYAPVVRHRYWEPPRRYWEPPHRSHWVPGPRRDWDDRHDHGHHDEGHRR
jgi:hypothetical protein